MLRGLSLDITVAHSLDIKDETIREWFGGVDIKFANSVRPTVFDVKDYSSVTINSERAGEELDRIVKSMKAFYHPGDFIPSDLSFAPGSLVVREDRLRYVTDWSNNDVQLNQACEDQPVDYKSYHNIINHFQLDAFFFGLDLKDCFAHWPLSPNCRRLFGFRNSHTLESGCFTFLPQGLSPSPGINDKNIKACIAAARRDMPNLLLFDFVDDIRGTLIGPDATNYDAVLHAMEHTIKTWKRLGLKLHGPGNPKKFILPTRIMDWIGCTLNSSLARVFLQDEKYEKIIRCIIEFRELILIELPPVRTVTQITGLLNWSLFVILKGQVHLRCFYREIVKTGVLPLWQKGFRNANPIILSIDGFMEELQWWEDIIRTRPFLQIHTTERGTPFVWTRDFIRGNQQVVDELAENLLVLTTDASSLGWGATINDRSFQGAWPADIAVRSSNFRELRTVLEWAQGHAHSFPNAFILLRTDNSCTVHYINKGTGRFPELAQIAERCEQVLRPYNIVMIAEHIKGVHNIAADALSRFFDTSGPDDPFPHKCLTSQIWNAIQARFQVTFQMEAFTDPSGHSARVPFRFSENNSIFQVLPSIWKDLVSWWNPPGNLRFACLKHILECMKDESSLTKKKVFILAPNLNKTTPFLAKHFKQIFKLRKGAAVFHTRNHATDTSIIPPDGEKWWVYTLV